MEIVADYAEVEGEEMGNTMRCTRATVITMGVVLPCISFAGPSGRTV
jgi:hypothetical protein